MALVIHVPKTEMEKMHALDNHVAQLCVAVEEAGKDRIYVPVSGKLIDILKLFYQHEISYTIHPAKPTNR